MEGTARARGLPSSVQDSAPTCQRRRPLRKLACACNALMCHVAGFSLGRRRTMSACRARALHRAVCGRFMPYRMALHEREPALVRCKAVLPRASRNLLRRPFARAARLCAPALAVSGEEAQHVRLPPARPALCWLKSLHTLWNGTARARDLRYSVGGRAPMCQLRRSLREPACACSACALSRCLSLERRRSTRAFCKCAPRTAPAAVAKYRMEGHCTSERPPFFGARPCSHVPAAASTSRAGLRV